MAVFQSVKNEETARIIEGYKGFLATSLSFLPDNKQQQQFSIRAYLEPLILQRLFEQAIPISLPCIEDLSKAATWEALYSDTPMPDVEKNAVDAHAGSLDAFLPANIPLDTILKHVKG